MDRLPMLALQMPNLPVLDDLLLMLLGAMVVALITRRLRIPYTVGLVVAGTIIGFLRHQGALPSGEGHFELTQEFILLILLPPLLFDGAMNTPFNKLRENSGIISTMALLGTFGCILITSAAIRCWCIVRTSVANIYCAWRTSPSTAARHTFTVSI